MDIVQAFHLLSFLCGTYSTTGVCHDPTSEKVICSETNIEGGGKVDSESYRPVILRLALGII